MSDITLTHTVSLVSVTLPGTMLWPDRYTWAPVVQQVDRGVDGALLVQTQRLTAGREITLDGGTSRAWVTRDVVEQLRAWAADPMTVMRLAIRGELITVIWRHSDGQALDVREVDPRDDDDPADYSDITLRLLSIA
jgi:hypothetical protein